MSNSTRKAEAPRFDPLPARAIVREIKSDKAVREHDFDFNNFAKRRWLTKLLVWALFNGHSVEIIATADDEPEKPA